MMMPAYIDNPDFHLPWIAWILMALIVAVSANVAAGQAVKPMVVATERDGLATLSLVNPTNDEAASAISSD